VSSTIKYSNSKWEAPATLYFQGLFLYATRNKIDQSGFAEFSSTAGRLHDRGTPAYVLQRHLWTSSPRFSFIFTQLYRCMCSQEASVERGGSFLSMEYFKSRCLGKGFHLEAASHLRNFVTPEYRQLCQPFSVLS